MLIIEFLFAFVSLIVMCCAYNERMTRDQANHTNATRNTTKTTKDADNILTSEQQFHTLIETIDAQICLGLFGFARRTCLNAFETLASARLSRKTVSAELYPDMQQLAKYVHELELETEALPLYRKVKDTLKRDLDDNHVITQHAKVQTRQLHNLTNHTEPTWRDALLGKNIRELVPLLVGDGWYEKSRDLITVTKKCAPAQPCYAVRTVRKR